MVDNEIQIDQLLNTDDQSTMQSSPKVHVVFWTSNLSEKYFAAIFRDSSEASRCFNAVQPFSLSAEVFVGLVIKECKHLDTSDIDCESVTEIPDNVHLVITLNSVYDIYRVHVYETRDSAEQYAHLASYFELSAVFTNIPIRDSYTGLDQSYVMVEAKEHHNKNSLKESHPLLNSIIHESIGKEQVFEDVD